MTDPILPKEALQMRSLNTVLATMGGGSSSLGLSASSSLQKILQTLTITEKHIQPSI